MDAQDLPLQFMRPPSASGCSGYFPQTGREFRTYRNVDTLSNSTISATRNNVASNPFFKTRVCRNFWSTGTCRYGDNCIFAHGSQDRRRSRMMNQNSVKRLPCRFSWKKCPYGKDSMLLHEESETYGEKGDVPQNCLKKYKSAMQPVGVDYRRPFYSRAMFNTSNCSSRNTNGRGQAEFRRFAPNFASESRNAQIATMALVKSSAPKHSQMPTASQYKLPPRAWAWGNWNKKVIGIYADWINEEFFSVW